MAINKRERTLLIATIAFVVVGINYFLVAPLAGKWRDVTGKLDMQRRQLVSIKANIAQQPEWQREYDDLGKKLKKSEQFKSISDVLKKVDEVVGTSGVLMQSKRPGRGEERDVYQEWPVSCSFESTIESLVKFLYGLQNSAGFMTVESLNVSAKPDNSGILRCEVQIRALAAKGAS